MSYQDSLDAEYKALLKKLEDATARLRKQSLYTPINLQAEEAKLLKAHNEQLNAFLKREHAYKQTQSIIDGNYKDKPAIQITEPYYDPPRKPDPKKNIPDLDKNQDKMKATLDREQRKQQFMAQMRDTGKNQEKAAEPPPAPPSPAEGNKEQEKTAKEKRREEFMQQFQRDPIDRDRDR